MPGHMRTVTLHNSQNGHDKLYEVQIVDHINSANYSVYIRWGRNTGNLRLSENSTHLVRLECVSLAAALREMRHIVREKVARGYRVIRTHNLNDEFWSVPAVPATPATPVPQVPPVAQATARLVAETYIRTMTVEDAQNSVRQAVNEENGDCGPALTVLASQVSALDFWRR